jgi:hypothetical protein
MAEEYKKQGRTPPWHDMVPKDKEIDKQLQGHEVSLSFLIAVQMKVRFRHLDSYNHAIVCIKPTIRLTVESIQKI